ncbi:hypothetical protein Tco_0543847 [Tanacetum coccineum]
MEAMKITPELAPREIVGKTSTYVPPANGVCAGGSRNNTIMIPIAIHGNLPDRIRHTITKMCLFFNKIHSKVIDPELLDQWQRDTILTICELEMYFPPSFFDVMVHLEPTKGSIIEGATEEAIEFYTDYSNRVKTVGITQSRHEGRLHGEGTLGSQDFSPNIDDLREAHFTVLQHMTCIAPYIYEHKSLLKQQNKKGQVWLANKHNDTFSHWLKNKVRSTLSNVDKVVADLGFGPIRVVKYQGYVINRYTFYTKEQDDKSTLQNSGVTLIASTTELSTVNREERSKNAKKAYYGVIQEIWKLHYNSTVIPLFKCKWVDNEKGVDVDEDGFTTVNLSTNGYKSEPFMKMDQFLLSCSLDKAIKAGMTMLKIRVLMEDETLQAENVECPSENAVDGDNLNPLSEVFFPADPDKEPLDACKRKEAFQRVRKWTRKLNLLQKDYIFIPVNYKEVATYQDEDVTKLSKVPCVLHMDPI